MSNRINPYRSLPITAYQRPEPARETTGTEPVRASEAAPRPAASKLAQQVPLSAEEQRMIDEHFPPRPTLTLRLYGPDQSTRTVYPAALGTRLDVRG
ncbi:MAG: hypothetical protein D6790_14760 [Caldilineae bacterium]|nr:MAG: hypothetical protein D6790_14760 [Caldilineae bacterium]